MSDTPKDLCPDCLRPPGNPSCVTCRSETPDTPSTEARPHDPFCVLFGINDLMQGRESDCTCAARRSVTSRTEVLTPEQVAFQRGRDSWRGTLHVWRGLCGHVWDRRDEDTDDCPRCAERAVRQEAADTSGHTFVHDGQTHCRCGLDDVERLSQEAADTSGPREALERLASWDEMAGNGDPQEFPEPYRAEVRARINTARAALEGASERPLDVEREVKRLIDADPYPADAHVARRILAPILARLASPTTTTPETEG